MNKIVSEYPSCTLQADNLQRLFFLPCFPCSIEEQHHRLLLTNVPVNMLSVSQLQCRQPGMFKRQFNYIEKKDRKNIPSFMKFIYRNFIRDLSRKLKVDESIIDFNLTRLNQITIQTALQQRQPQLRQAYHMREWPVALEIFLQIDVDTFFMKTCSYRGSHPRLLDETNQCSTEEGLFCLNPPDTRHLMLPCTNSSCPCCYQSLAVSHRYQPSVEFACEQPHHFVNGYEIYLNTHATCQTTNFIYVLTCPCRQFDFIGSSHDTNQSFKDILFHHRRESVRVLHEFLLGDKIIQRTFDMYERQKTNEQKQADQQRLYQHLTECSAAIQLLLNRSAHYWNFVPMENDEASEEDRVLSINNLFTHSSSSHQDDSENWSSCERIDQDAEWCLANVRQPPNGTRYSRLQLHKQKALFKHGWDHLFLPPRHLDLFNMAIIFVLPENCSPLLCQVIESLLITHAECKLNTHGHLFNNKRVLSTTEQSSNSWYKNLVGRHYK